jgi:hypothetical protein
VQTLAVNDPVVFDFVQLNKNFTFTPTQSAITIQLSGVYEYNIILAVNQPSQFTLFINGIPDGSTTSGINSAGVGINMHQLLVLQVGDVVDLRNYESAVAGGIVDISPSQGGLLPGTSVNVDMSMNRIDSLDLTHPEVKKCSKPKKHRHSPPCSPRPCDEEPEP